MRALVAYDTYTCDRCGCAESVSATPMHGKPRTFLYPMLPQGWAYVAEKHLCPRCKTIVNEALGITIEATRKVKVKQ